MANINRIVIYGLSVFMVISLLIYALLPSIIVQALQSALPKDIHLVEAVIHRPNFTAIHIPSLALIQGEYSGNRLEINNTTVQYQLLPFKVNRLEIEAINASIKTLSSQMLSITTQDNPSEDTELKAKIPRDFFPSSLKVNSYTATVAMGQLFQEAPEHFQAGWSELLIQGHLNVEQQSQQFQLELSNANQKLLHSEFMGKDWQQFQFKLLLENFDLGLLQPILTNYFETQSKTDTLTFKETLKNTEGTVSIDLLLAHHFNQPLLSFEDQHVVLIPPSPSFTLMDQLELIDQLNASIKLKQISTQFEQMTLSSLEGLMHLEKHQHWALRDSHLTGQLHIEALGLPLETHILPFGIQVPKGDIRHQTLYSEVLVHLFKEQNLSILSEIPFDLSKPSSHQLEFQLGALDQLQLDRLKDINIEDISGKMGFHLKKGAAWTISSLNTKALSMANFHYHTDANMTAQFNLLEADIRWQEQFQLGENPLIEAHFIAKDLRLQAPAFKLSTQMHTPGKLVKTASGYLLEVGFLPQANPSNTLTLSGNIKATAESNQWSFQTDLQTTLEEPEPVLIELFPEHEAILQVIEINQGQPIAANAKLSGIYHINESKTPNMPLTPSTLSVKGRIDTSANLLSLGSTMVNPLNLSLQWPELGPWSSPHLQAQANINYLGIDLQQHVLSTDLKLEPELHMRNLSLQSELLNGTLSAQTPSEYLTMEQLNGRIIMDEIDLALISKIIDDPKLSMSGALRADIPFIISNHFISLQNGEIGSDDGVIEYLPEEKKIVLTKDNVSNIANIALQNFHYSVMEANLVKASPCELQFKIRLVGKNPDLGDRQSQIFNIDYHPKSNVNLYYLLLLGEDNIQKLDLEQLYSGCDQAN